MSACHTGYATRASMRTLLSKLMSVATRHTFPPRHRVRLVAAQCGPASPPAQVEAAAAAAATADAYGPLLRCLTADAPACAGGTPSGASRPHLWRGLAHPSWRTPLAAACRSSGGLRAAWYSLQPPGINIHWPLLGLSKSVLLS